MAWPSSEDENWIPGDPSSVYGLVSAGRPLILRYIGRGPNPATVDRANPQRQRTLCVHAYIVRYSGEYLVAIR